MMENARLDAPRGAYAAPGKSIGLALGTRPSPRCPSSYWMSPRGDMGQMTLTGLFPHDSVAP